MKIQLPVGHTLPTQNSVSGIDNLAAAKRLAMQKLSEVTAARQPDGSEENRTFSAFPIRGQHIDIRC